MDPQKSEKHADYLPIPTSSYPLLVQAPAPFLSKTKKLVLLASFSGFLLYTVAHSGGHGLSGLWNGEFKEGWDMVMHGGMKHLDWDEQRWEWDERGNHQKDHFSQLSFSNLDLSEVFGMEHPNATFSMPAARSFFLNVGDGIEAQLYFSPSVHHTHPSVYVEQVLEESHDEETALLKSADQLAVVDAEKFTEESGLTINREAGSQSRSSYIISVSLPTNGEPFSFFAQGDSLSVPAVSMKDVSFDSFSLTTGLTEGVQINDLNAREASIDLAFGGISGSFNISRELVLRTGIGAINASVVIYEDPNHGCHRGENKTHHFEGRSESEHSSESEHPHHGKGPHGRGPHGPKPHLVKVITTTGVGAIDLAYVDSALPSNKTSLLSKSVADIGKVRVVAVKGFQGKFVEGSKIGEVSYEAPSGTNVTIDKEVHHGPGGFIKGFVGSRPHPPHKGKKHCKHPHDHDGKKKHHGHGKDDDEEEHRPDHHSKPPQDKEGKHPKHKESKHPHSKPEHEEEEDVDRVLYKFKGDEKKRIELKGGRRVNKRVSVPEDEELAPSEDEELAPSEDGPHGPPPPKDGPHGPPPPKDGPHRPSPPKDGPHGPPGRGGPPGPPPKGPKGPHHGHRGPPPPPPGFGFFGAFAGTGQVEIIFA